MSKRKILILVKRMDGGTGTFVLDLLGLEKKGVEFTICSLEKPRYRQIHNLKINYFNSNKVYPELYGLSPLLLIRLIKEIFWFSRTRKGLAFNLIFCIDPHCLLVAFLSKMFFGDKVKIIASIHNNIRDAIKEKSTKLIQPIVRTFFGLMLKSGGPIVCVSHGLSKDVKEYFGIAKLPKTIYYGIEGPKVRRPKPLHKKNKILLSVARFNEQKDFITLIHAFLLVIKKVPDTFLYLVGDGPQKNKVRRYVDSLGISKQVKFLGWSQNPSNIYKRSDVFILSSRREGFGYVLIEAMSFGIPVVSTNTPFGPSEILENEKYGLLTPMNNPKTMALKILEIITNEKEFKYFSQKSIERSRYFSISKMLQGYEEIIKQA